MEYELHYIEQERQAVPGGLMLKKEVPTWYGVPEDAISWYEARALCYGVIVSSAYGWTIRAAVENLHLQLAGDEIEEIISSAKHVG